jgi:hypothetical protein
LEEVRHKWESESRKLAKASANVVPIWNEVTNDAELYGPANDNRLAGLFQHYEMEMAA